MNVRVPALTAGRSRARRAANGRTAEGAARAGLAARGVIYLLVGVLALQIAFGNGGRQADRSGALAELSDKPFGSVLLWALGLGLVGMALWRLSEALFGAVGRNGRTARKRLAAAARCVFYAFVAYSVLAFAAGSGSGSGGSGDQQSRDVTARLMEVPAGRWLVGVAGAAVVVAGVVIGVQAARRSYRSKLRTGELDRRTRRLIDVTGVGGGVARGLVFAAGGAFAVRAAVDYAPDRAKGLDDTLRSFADTPLGPGCWSASRPGWCSSASSPSRSPAGAGSDPRRAGNTGGMNEHEIPPDGRPVDVYLDLLRVRMESDDYRLLLKVVEPVLRAIDEDQLPTIDFSLDGEDAEALPQEIRDEAALVIATAVTGRLDNEVVEISTDETGPVRVVTDAATASDPARLGEIADYLKERHRQNEELRGIAEASGLPTDF